MRSVFRRATRVLRAMPSRWPNRIVSGRFRGGSDRCNFLTQNVSGTALPNSPHVGRRGRQTRMFEPRGDGVDDMNSKGSARKFQSRAALRVGVIGAGVMGTNRARGRGGLPNPVLVGIVDPLAEHRDRAPELAGCRASASLDEWLAEGVDAV